MICLFWASGARNLGAERDSCHRGFGPHSEIGNQVWVPAPEEPKGWWGAGTSHVQLPAPQGTPPRDGFPPVTEFSVKPSAGTTCVSSSPVLPPAGHVPSWALRFPISAVGAFRATAGCGMGVRVQVRKCRGRHVEHQGPGDCPLPLSSGGGGGRPRGVGAERVWPAQDHCEDMRSQGSGHRGVICVSPLISGACRNKEPAGGRLDRQREVQTQLWPLPAE